LQGTDRLYQFAAIAICFRLYVPSYRSPEISIRNQRLRLSTPRACSELIAGENDAVPGKCLNEQQQYRDHTQCRMLHGCLSCRHLCPVVTLTFTSKHLTIHRVRCLSSLCRLSGYSASAAVVLFLRTPASTEQRETRLQNYDYMPSCTVHSTASVLHQRNCILVYVTRKRPTMNSGYFLLKLQ